jgi:hypothetical protein
MPIPQYELINSLPKLLDSLRRDMVQWMQSENSGVMLPKFCLDPNQASRHKHALSVTLGWV